MGKKMRVELGKFACFCLESRFGSDLTSGVQSAARYYSRQLQSSSGRSPNRVRHLRAEGPIVEVEVALDEEVLGPLEVEARSRSVDVQQILNHAVLVYMADLDRVA
jgi:hypothetical protein